jgi:nucleoside-diphosphate-sugar epimerase
MIREQAENAVQGSEICYLTVGMQYSTKVWQEKWHPLIRNVVDACIKHQSKLVLFDNVYAIGGDNIKHITERSPISPNSKKGEVRAAVDNYIQENIEAGKLDAIIARSPDFFGSVKENSILMNVVYNNLVNGKKAQWFCDADVPHTMGYTPDLAQGTAILGNTPAAFNQIWNLPVDNNALTGREWVKLFADEMNASAEVQVLSAWEMRAVGLLIPIVQEIYEVRYQYDREYYFDSSKFVTAFNYTPTTNKNAVKQTLEKMRSTTSSR